MSQAQQQATAQNNNVAANKRSEEQALTLRQTTVNRIIMAWAEQVKRNKEPEKQRA